MKKKKDTTPVPVSSQRQDQPQPVTTATTQSLAENAAVASVTTEAVTGASEDIFAQVEKLEEDLGLGPKRRKAKEVCHSPLSGTLHFLVPLSLLAVSRHRSPLIRRLTDSSSRPAAQVLDGTLQDVPP